MYWKTNPIESNFSPHKCKSEKSPRYLVCISRKRNGKYLCETFKRNNIKSTKDIYITIKDCESSKIYKKILKISLQIFSLLNKEFKTLKKNFKNFKNTLRKSMQYQNQFCPLAVNTKVCLPNNSSEKYWEPKKYYYWMGSDGFLLTALQVSWLCTESFRDSHANNVIKLKNVTQIHWHKTSNQTLKNKKCCFESSFSLYLHLPPRLHSVKEREKFRIVYNFCNWDIKSTVLWICNQLTFSDKTTLASLEALSNLKSYADLQI